MKKLLISLFLFTALIALAQEKPIRPVTSSYMLELGSSHVADTYLSPLTYNGWSAALTYERMQAMKFDPERWVMRLDGSISFDRGHNLADNATMSRFDLALGWGMMRRWNDVFTPGLTMAIGGATGINGGVIYNPRNGNNPASAKGAWTVDLTGYASYNVKLWRLPVTFRYQATMPLIGAFFSPDYDELYYEIYLGNRSGLVHCAWFGTRFAMNNLLTADLHFGATTVRLGYRCYVMTSRVSNLTTNVWTNAAVIGITSEWISLSRQQKLSDDARIISALY